MTTYNYNFFSVLQQHPVYQQPHQHHSANELYEMYDEYATGTYYSYKVIKLI